LSKKHKHHHHHHRSKKQDENADRGTAGDDDTESEAGLPACVAGDASKKPGVDCKKVKPLPPCKGNKHEPPLTENEEAKCRILPKCADAPGEADCYNEGGT